MKPQHYLVFGFFVLLMIALIASPGNPPPPVVQFPTQSSYGVRISNLPGGSTFEVSGDIHVEVGGKLAKIITYRIIATSPYELTEASLTPVLSKLPSMVYMAIDKNKGQPPASGDFEKTMWDYLYGHGYTFLTVLFTETKP